MSTSFTVTRCGRMTKIQCDWVSDSSGDASGSTDEAFTGYLTKVDTVPIDGTLNLDVYVENSDGVDLLSGGGEDRSDSDVESAFAADSAGNIGPQAMVNTKLTFTVANAGDSKSGTIVAYVQEKA